MNERDKTIGGNDLRVLALLVLSHDAAAIPPILAGIGADAVMCATMEELCAELSNGAGVLLPKRRRFPEPRATAWVTRSRQPPWSELPIIVLLKRGAETQAARDALFLTGEVTLVERPVRVRTLVALIHSALGSRRRQYLVRDQLQSLEETTENLRQAEMQYHTLFDAIDEAYCIIEMRIEPNEPLDYRFIEVNQVFEKQSTLLDAKGKWMRELRPEHEESWFEIYRDVALTGTPIRFEHGGKELDNRWFSLYAFRVGDPEQKRVAVLFSDITNRKRSEEELREAKEGLEVRVQERTTELSRTVQTLQVETDERIQAVEELRHRDQLLIQQSRLAAMGEMLVNISHQWRQPLNVLGLILQELYRNYKRGTFSQEYLESSVAKAKQQISVMSRTIDDFRDFLNPQKIKVSFDAKDVVEASLSLIKESFQQARIEVRMQAEEPVSIEGYRNEYSQALLNILLNARDILLERRVANPKVTIRIFSRHGKSVVTITDNAGGIPVEIMDKIFDPYFTTKPPDKGTGIGLFMSRTIIETNMSGKLSVQNTGEGAEFKIEV